MKKIGFLALLISATLLLTLAFPVVGTAPKAPAAVSAAAPVPPHPRVHDAIEELRHAREHMMHAEGEFHGHRDKTIEHIDAAIHEAEVCMQEP